MVAATGEKNVWLVGGGELVGQFYDHGLLDEMFVQVGSVTLGSGKPLLPRAITSPPFKLVAAKGLGTGFVELHYEVPRQAPTAAAIHVLRSYPRAWVGLSSVAVGIAITGVVAVLLFSLGQDAPALSPLATWSSVSGIRILLTPVLAPTFGVAALASPHQRSRRALLAAAAAEVAVGGYAGLVWLLGR
jgi:hypothetical protein